MISYDFIRQPTIFGLEVVSDTTPTLLNRVSDTGAYWMRKFVFSWKDIEPVSVTPPVYHWEAVDEASLREAHQRKIQVIATVKFTPSWAHKIPGYSCGPVAQASLGKFAQFMQALVRRYGFSDYQVKYWEIGNEPDVDPIQFQVPKDNIFGCWGDTNDSYYGGGYYATMLQQVSPAIKAVDPEAKVLNGGLLLDCDPTNPQGKDCKSSKFFEGILRGGGAPYFDVANYHGYVYFVPGAIPDINNPSWGKRGGVSVGKADFLRSVMASYGVSKPVINTESSLLCTDKTHCPEGGTPSVAFLEQQADYVVSVFVRTWAAGLMANIWFEIEGPGWREVGLLDRYQQPRPAYYVYQFLARELAGGRFVGTLAQFPSVMAYEFSLSGKRVWVLWSADASSHTITLPAGVTKIYDKLGNPLTPSGGTLSIKSPVYLELAP